MTGISAAISNQRSIYAALELSKNSWLLAIQVPGRDNPSLHPIKGGDAEGLMAKLGAARERVAKVTGQTPTVTLCYEAGYDGKNDRGAWGEMPTGPSERWSRLCDRYDDITEKHPKARAHNNSRHMGTLGTGNHFIEVCLDESEQVWVMLHSGSRGCGNRIGMYFIQAAKKEMERWFINLPDKDLAYLVEGSELFGDYVEAVEWAQDYAYENRKEMMSATLEALRKSLPEFAITGMAVNCHHNYVAKEHHFGANVWLTRKGAVRAREGDLGIIPGSMGVRSYIVRGKGNPMSFHSCSHGAGAGHVTRTGQKAILSGRPREGD